MKLRIKLLESVKDNQAGKDVCPHREPLVIVTVLQPAIDVLGRV